MSKKDKNIRDKNSIGNWQAWVQIKWKPGAPADAWKGWEESSWVKGVWSTQGNWDCSVWLDVASPSELEKFVWQDVRKNKWVEDTETSWAKKCA